jgi:hypothetical protein
MEHSVFQKQILSFSDSNIKFIRSKGDGNIINMHIEASAGSGKSFLLGEIFRSAYEEQIPLKQILVLSFVRNLKAELERTFKKYVVAEDRKELESLKVVRTFNSVGLQLMSDAWTHWNKMHPDKPCSLREIRDTSKYSRIVQRLIDQHQWNPFVCSKSQIVSIIDHLREQCTAQPTLDDLSDIISRFNIRNNIVHEHESELLHKIVSQAILEGIRSANPYYTDQPCADWIDHCWLPILLGQSQNPEREKFDHFKYALEDFVFNNRLLLVDETQDINPVLLNMVKAFNHDGNCVVIVGDDEQNIYVWRGSRARGMKELANALNAQSFSLPISYRLSRNHVAMIKDIWSDKKIMHFHEKDSPLILLEAQDGDSHLDEVSKYLTNDKLTKLIVGRKNSSIFSLGLKLVSRGYLVSLTGITADAKNYAKQVLGCYKSGQSINFPDDPSDLFLLIAKWAESQKQYLIKREARPAEIDQVDDWACALVSICLSGDDLPQSWDEWEDRIDELNSRKKSAIKLSTIHSAKGAEAEVVIFADPDCAPLMWNGQSPLEREQEMNALFVALSRAKLSDHPDSGTLILVTNQPVYALNGWLAQYANHATNLSF